MRRSAAWMMLLLTVGTPSAFAQRKDCEELKAEIGKKIDANGVKNYTLSVVPAADVKEDEKVVGSCDGGTKRVVYKRN